METKPEKDERETRNFLYTLSSVIMTIVALQSDDLFDRFSIRLYYCTRREFESYVTSGKTQRAIFIPHRCDIIYSSIALNKSTFFNSYVRRGTQVEIIA